VGMALWHSQDVGWLSAAPSAALQIRRGNRSADCVPEIVYRSDTGKHHLQSVITVVEKHPGIHRKVSRVQQMTRVIPLYVGIACFPTIYGNTNSTIELRQQLRAITWVLSPCLCTSSIQREVTPMSTVLVSPPKQADSIRESLRGQVDQTINELITSLPEISHLTTDERRGIIARYTAVLEGNFIYWMTATYLATQCKNAHPVLLDNLYEEVRDSHPVMLRKFAIAAHALPTADDARAVDEGLTEVRLFLGKLSGVQSLLTMGFFEGFIQRFMGYLADLAAAQGSLEREYTDVHGVCDIAHSEGLFQALAVEMDVHPLQPGLDLFEGVDLLRKLLEAIVHPHPDALTA
jgi:hypothetical protein